MIKIVNLKPKDKFIKNSIKALINSDMLPKKVNPNVDEASFNKLLMAFNLLKSVVIRGLEINNPTVESLKRNGFKQTRENVWYHDQVGTIQVKCI